MSQSKVKILDRYPGKNEGFDGDMVVRFVRGVATLFVKIAGSWYSSSLNRVDKFSFYAKDGVRAERSALSTVSVNVPPRYTYTSSSGANTTIEQLPIVLPPHSIITKIVLGIHTLSDIYKYDIALWKSDTDALALNANLGSVSGTHTEILGAGASGTRSTDSTGSATDIDIGYNANDINKLWYNEDKFTPTGSGNNYLYLVNAGILNGAVDQVDDLTPTPSAAWQASQSHTNQSQSGTNGAGTGSKWSIITDGSGNPTFTLDTSNRGWKHTDNEQLTFTDPGSTTNTAVLQLDGLYQPQDGKVILTIQYYAQPSQSTMLSLDQIIAKERGGASAPTFYRSNRVSTVGGGGGSDV